MVTGHRPNKLWGYDLTDENYTKLRELMASAISYQAEVHGADIIAITGMALGVDQLFAEVALEHPDVTEVHAYVPFEGFEAKWPQHSKDHYENLLDQCANVEYVSEGGYAAYKMQVRNEAMVNEAHAILAVWDGTAGGTANTVKAAKKAKHGSVMKIDPTDMKRGWKFHPF